MEDEIVKLNVDGYEVTFILEDRWTLLQTLGSLLLLIVTALIYTKSPGYLILAVKRA